MNLNQEGVSTHKVRGEEESEFIFYKDVCHGGDPQNLPSTRAQPPSLLEGEGGHMRGKRSTNAALLDRAAHTLPTTAATALAVQPHSILPPPALGVTASSSSVVDGGALHAGVDQEALCISFEVEPEQTVGEGATAEEEEEDEDLWEDVDGEPAPPSVSATEVKLERAEREAAEGAASDAEEGGAQGAESEVRCV